MSLRDKLALLAESKKRHPRLETNKAGDEGEDRADKAIDDLLRGRMAKRYSAIRVPKSKSKGKHEIDLLVASPSGIAALEVKHWGGQVETKGRDQWLQSRSRGGQVTHESPLLSNSKKLDDLLVYLQERKQAYNKDQSYSGVLLTNDNVNLARDIAEDKNVLRLDQLETWLKPRILKKTGILSRVLGRNRAPFRERIRFLDQLPTWDTVFLHGGRQLKGDVVGKGIRLNDGNTLSRRMTRLAKFHIPRTKLGLIKTPKVSWRGDADQGRAALDMNQTVEIKISGRSSIETVPVAWITSIEFGWQDESYYDAPKPPLKSYEGQSYQGKVTGVQEYGVFIDLDSHRDGLVHVRRLEAAGRSPQDFKTGESVRVRVLKTEVKNGKERIDLDFA